MRQKVIFYDRFMTSATGLRVFGLHLVILALLLTQVTLAAERVSLQMLSSNSSTVDLACRYEGNKTDLFFKVYRESDPCIFYKSTCQYYSQNDCKIQCKESGDPNVVLFSMNFTGHCHERAHLRCSVRSLADRQNHFQSDSFLALTAPSDPPEILVADKEPATVFKEVPIECKVANLCVQTKLEISGAHMTPPNISYTKQGGRLACRAVTSAIFNSAGNYTITCKEDANRNTISSKRTIEVQHSKPVGLSSGDEGVTKEPVSRDDAPPLWQTDHFIVILALSAVIVLLFILLILQCRKNNQKAIHQRKTLHPL